MKLIIIMLTGFLLSGCALDSLLNKQAPTSTRKSEFLECVLKLHEAGIKQELIENLCQKALRE